MKRGSYVRRFICVLGASGLLAFPSAVAQTPAVQTITPVYLIKMMAVHDMPAEFVDIDDAEGPTLAAMSGDFSFLASFEACDENGDGCEILVLRCGFSFAPEDQPDQAAVNLWNRETWGKAFIDEDGDPWISLELNVVGGLTEENLSDTLMWWSDLIVDFADAFGYQTS